jgi:hypothetical protein
MPDSPGPRAVLIQLPLNTAAPLEPTGNVPLAAGAVAAAAGQPPGCIAGPGLVDELGDRALVARIAEGRPELVAFTLYCWNAERSVALARSLRERLPRAVLLAGGPEVQADNSWLRGERAFDLLVSGEGEPMARHLLDPAGAAVFAESSGGFLEIPPSSFPPGAYPDPWLSGHIRVAETGSVSMETIRGCASGCLFCSYRRRHPQPRRMGTQEILSRCSELVGLGADEIVFLDPTFNSRPDLEEILDGLQTLRTTCFAEIRGESVTAPLARKFARAGFRTVEIGLQTSSASVLASCGRPGSFRKAAEGARRMAAAGVKPVLDLMLGLPGDVPEGPVGAARQLSGMGFGFDAQVFFLAVLPGTDARARSTELGLEWMDRPPYYVTASGPLGFGELEAAREEIADILGYDLDFRPRPLLFEGSPATEEFDLDAALPEEGVPPSFRHGAIRLRAADLWAHRGEIARLVERRRAADPYCVLDVILLPGRPFPLDLLDSVRSLDREVDYGGRVARLHGFDGNLRVSVLVEDWKAFPAEWLEEAAGSCPVVADIPAAGELPGELLDADVGFRLPGEGHDLPALAASVPFEDRVFFRSRLLEKLWTEGILGL